MKIQTVRRISQTFFLALFVWFMGSATIGNPLHPFNGWRVNWFLEVDPLAVLGMLLTSHAVYRGMAWALIVIAMTAMLGRFFCGWACPFGTLHHTAGYLAHGNRKAVKRIALNQYLPVQQLKYYLLIAMLGASGSGLIVVLPRMAGKESRIVTGIVITAVFALLWLTLRRFFRSRRTVWTVAAGITGFWMAVALSFPDAASAIGSLQIGLLDPMALMHRTFSTVVVPLLTHLRVPVASVPRFHDGAFFIGVLFLAAVFLNVLRPRFYCRFICPLGALLGVIGRSAPFRVARISGKCTGCRQCETACEGACAPGGTIRSTECVLCLNCTDVCRDGALAYRPPASGDTEITGPDFSRRGFVLSLSSGLIATPLFRLDGMLHANWNPALIRPPGVLAEADFLGRCLKCGLCMRVCPTNVLQPAWLQAGLEGLWTPVLNNRIGAGACQPRCTACGHVCPTAAIRPMSVDERMGRGAYEGKGPIRIGTAFVDRGRCLPWAMNRPCIVCQEVCPVSPKAITAQELHHPVSGFTVESVNDEAGSLKVVGGNLNPAAWSGGDYFARLDFEQDTPLVPIRDNTADTLFLGERRLPEPGRRITVMIRLHQPVVDPVRCIGCGICEHGCPVQGRRAIRITAENESRHRGRAMLL